MTSETEKYYVGVDVSKDFLDVFILPTHHAVQLTNDQKGLQTFIQLLKPLSMPQVVLEATGGYEKEVVHLLARRDICVTVVNPRRIRDVAKACGKLAKTDRIDAKMIALFAQHVAPKAQVRCTEKQAALSAMHTRRQQLVEMITMEKNRLYLAERAAKQSIQRVLKLLEKELAELNKTLENCIETDAELTKKNNCSKRLKGLEQRLLSAYLRTYPSWVRFHTNK